jgi:hypothetical protein
MEVTHNYQTGITQTRHEDMQVFHLILYIKGPVDENLKNKLC